MIFGVSLAFGNLFVMVFSIFSGVIRFCIILNSLVTIIKFSRVRRSTFNRLIGSRVFGTIIVGDVEVIVVILTFFFSVISSFLVRIISMILFSLSRYIGNRLCGEESSCSRILSISRLALI